MITSTIRKRIGWALGAAMGLFYFSSGVSAQMDPKAWDNASQSAYSGGSWANGSNGGSGFNAWSIVYTGGDWKGSYAGNPAEKGLSGMTNPSWGMYAHTAAGNKVEATRTFTALAVGDELSFKWAFNWDSGSTPGKGIKIFAGASQVIDINNAGNANITVNGVNTAFGYGVNAMTWTIKRINTTQLTITANDRDGSGTYTTTITAGAPTSIQFYINRQSDNNGNREPFFNDLKIQPTVKYNQTITFAEGAWQSKTYGDANFNLSATASSGLTVSFASSDTSVATVSGNTVTILKAGTTTITASQAGNNNYNAATSVQRTLTVSKKNPTVSGWPTATAITLGQTLSDSSLVGGSSTPAGSFAWTNPSYEPTEAGTASYSVTFTPTDTVNYNTAQNDVSLTVNEVEKQDPVIDTWPTSSAITYGQTLASSTLSGGSANVDGHFEWSDDTIVPVVGSPAQSVTFYPDDDEAYNTAISTVAITVNKADPSVTTWPTASAITYGQTLASSTLSGGSATPAGSFAFTTPSTAPDIGTAAQSVTYTPTDTANYNTAQSTVSVTVNKATPTITTPPTASIIFVGDSLADSTLSGGAASVDGTFAFTTPSTTPARGTADQSVTFTPTDGTRYNTVQFNVSVSVWYDAITFYAKTPSWADHNPNDPQVWGPFVAAQGWSGHTMTYDSESGWWSVMVEVDDATAQITYQWRICETNATKYQKAIGGATDPTFTTTTGEIWIDGSSDTSYTWYGANDFALAPAAITDGGELPEPTPVMFYARIPSWADGAPNGPVIWGPFTSSEWTDHAMTYDSELGWWKVEVGVLYPDAPITYQLRFSENGTNKYQKATGDATFATDATFTTTTDAIWIDGSQDSHFVWSEGDNFYLLCGRVTETEPALETVTFYARTPSWADHVPDNPQIWGPFLGDDCWSVHTMTYDTELGWWTVEVDVLDASAELTYLLRFCQTGTNKFQKATGDDTFSIDPTFTTTTDEIWIDGSVDANFVWSLANDFYLVAGKVTEDQPKDDQTITFEEGAWQTKTYGDAAFDLVATASSGLTVTFASDNVNVATIFGDTVTIVGVGTATITASQAGNDSYNAAPNVERVLTVNKANQTITFAEGAWQTKTYGDAAFDLEASASSGLDVSFESLNTAVATISGDTVTIVGAGTATIRATQSGNANYNAAEAVDRVLTVSAREITVTPDADQNKVYDAADPTFTYTLSEDVDVTGALGREEGEDVGFYAFTLGTLSAGDNYSLSLAAEAEEFEITKATPVIETEPTASTITYGETLADSDLTGGLASVAGTFAWTTPGTAPAAGTADQSVTFTPTDADNYETVVFDVSVTVDKAIPTITTEPTASAITYGQTLADSTLSGGEASVAGSFDWTTPATAPASGTADQSVTFTPTDADNYETVVFDVSVTVGKAIPTITTEPTASAITYGQTLADSTLSGGEASVAGAFDWTTPATAPDVGTADQSVTFTPTDADNYEAVVFDVSVTVGKATPTITTPPEAGNIVVGQTLASSTLSGGEASVAGSFAWTDDSIEPLEGKADQSVTFTPTDGDNYETVVFDVSVTTLATEPEEHSASMAVTDPTAESLTLTWTTGSGERRIVVVRALYAVNWTPTDGVSPTGVNVDFSAAADQGNGNKICYDGAGNSVTLTGLTPNTLYWFKVFEYNGSKFGAKGLNTTGTENYYTDDIPLEGSGSTLPTSVVLYYFVAGAENGQAVLRWRTASEIDTVGFWVERQVGGAWMRVNDKIIYGKGEMGATYALVDAGAEIGGTYTWRIVEIETDGGQQIHGPFTRTVSELGFAAENPITVTPDGVLIRWLSREGESYKILRSTDLTQGFGVIEEDISATVPENEFLDETAGSIGMYLIQVDDE